MAPMAVTLLNLLVVIIVIGLLWWAAQSLFTVFSVPVQVQTVITVLVVIIFCLWLLSAFGLIGMPLVRAR